MLTKDDFSKLKKIVRDEVEAEGTNIRSEVGGDIRMAGIRTTSELREVKERLKNVEIQTSKVIKGVNKLQKDLKTTTNFLDKETIKTVKRVRKIEVHLNLPEPDFA